MCVTISSGHLSSVDCNWTARVHQGGKYHPSPTCCGGSGKGLIFSKPHACIRATFPCFSCDVNFFPFMVIFLDTSALHKKPFYGESREMSAKGVFLE